MELDKKQLRQSMIKKRLDLDESEYQQKSYKIIDQLKRNQDFQKAKHVGIYISYRHEVDTIQLIKEIMNDKNIYVPRVNGHEMEFIHINQLSNCQKNHYGILEPVDGKAVAKDKIDVMIVPLVAYDAHYNRLGYGGGYYDRYLRDFDGLTIGLAFSFQKVDQLVIEQHDLPLDLVINDEKVE